MKHPSKHVFIDDAQGFVAQLLNVYIGYHTPDGFLVNYAKPEVKIVGKGPIYHPFTVPDPPKQAKSSAYDAEPYDADACGWDEGMGLLCGEPASEHGKPRLEAKVGEWWTQYQEVVPPMHSTPPASAALRIPTQHVLEVGEALVAWAKANEGSGDSEIGPEAVQVVAEALVHERARTETLMAAIIDIAKSATGTDGAPTGDLFPQT